MTCLRKNKGKELPYVSSVACKLFLCPVNSQIHSVKKRERKTQIPILFIIITPFNVFVKAVV